MKTHSTRIIDTADPDQFVACGRPIADLTVTERGQFKARVVRIDIGQTWGQRVQERLACLKQIELKRSAVAFLVEPGPSMFFNGIEVGGEQVAVLSAGDHYWRLSGATHWGAVSPSEDDLDALCGAATGPCARRGKGVSVFAPSPVALARLRSVHERMGRMAETAPELLTNTDLASDLESDLMSAVHDLRRVDASTSTDTVAKRHHQIIVNRFYDVLEAQVETPLQMPAISQIIGVSSRTLRLACQEQLGVSPARYVMLRRMHSARRALRNAGPDVTCVTDIAMEYGFWELGRFAVNYRHFFGESPSATLRAAA